MSRAGKRNDKNRPTAIYGLISKNILNFPLGFDPITSVEVHRDPENNDFWICLCEGPEIVACLPHTTPSNLRRPPYAIDLALISLLIAEARISLQTFAHEYAQRQGRKAIDTQARKIDYHKKQLSEWRAAQECGEKVGPPPRREVVGKFMNGSDKADELVRSAGRIEYSKARRRARRKKPPKIVTVTFRSLRQLIERLGLTATTYNRARVMESLQYLSLISLDYESWHDPKVGKIHRMLLPPISQVYAKSNSQVKLDINGQWVDTRNGFYAKVPLPIPTRSATTCNLYMRLWAFRWGIVGAQRIAFGKLCEALGIQMDDSQDHITRAFYRALDQVNTHLQKLDREALEKDGLEIPEYFKLREVNKERQIVQVVGSVRPKSDPALDGLEGEWN